MKKFSLLFTLFLGIFIQAQVHRFIYEYEFTNDSTNLEKNKEFINLDIHKDYSVFFSQEKFVGDSLVLESIMRQRKITPNNIRIKNSREAKFPDIVKKQVADGKTFWTTNSSLGTYIVEEQPKFNWKIHNETQTIENYQCNKATLEYQGRRWTAWYTPEIPITDGPYKFYGLPGLIVKMVDEKDTHRFTLKGNHQLKNGENSWDYIVNQEKEAQYNQGVIAIKPKHFTKLWREYVNDTVKDLRMSLGNSNVSITMNIDGKVIKDKNEIIRIQEEIEKAKLKKLNNFLEPKLYF